MDRLIFFEMDSLGGHKATVSKEWWEAARRVRLLAYCDQQTGILFVAPTEPCLNGVKYVRIECQQEQPFYIPASTTPFLLSGGE